jgi:hypothetical protein
LISNNNSIHSEDEDAEFVFVISAELSRRLADAVPARSRPPNLRATRGTYQGYPLIGRRKELAEIGGVVTAVAAINRLPV